jgi:hypothetical protein
MFVKKNEIEDFLSGGKIQLPKNCDSVRIDVGLAGEAPNAAKWLLETQNRFVIGIEPIDHHWDMLCEFETADTDRPYPDFPFIQLSTDSIVHNRNTIGRIENRFFGIQCAISDVDSLCYSKFFQMDRTGGASGSSSLLEPTDKHPHTIEKVLEVPTIPLSAVLGKLEYKDPIEHIKTDCEAHDFSVVKSLGDHIENVCFITSEMTENYSHHKGSYNREEFFDYMSDKGFSIIRRRWGILAINSGEVHFVNKRLKGLIKSRGYESTTFGL